jgi:hypothetical protein
MEWIASVISGHWPGPGTAGVVPGKMQPGRHEIETGRVSARQTSVEARARPMCLLTGCAGLTRDSVRLKGYYTDAEQF